MTVFFLKKKFWFKKIKYNLRNMSIENLNLIESIKKIENRLEDIENRLSSLENLLKHPPYRPSPPIPPGPIRPGSPFPPEPFRI